MSTRLTAALKRTVCTALRGPARSAPAPARAAHSKAHAPLHVDRFAHYPKNVGVLALDSYFPKTYVAQEDLEKFDGISAGKYRVGLGQHAMAFVNDREDIYSISLTVVKNLMEKYGLSPNDIGRLEVATETIIDHSKAVKTVLMQLFAESGNTDIEGVDTINACYGGTNALFNSLAWIESSAWNGKYAIVVAADIAEYAKGNARPTGGAGAVAMLIGPNAPLVMERGARASHMEHAYDFYKPNLDSPYPVVDGKFSNTCYLRALDTCYQSYARKFQASYHKEMDLKTTDFALFHAPYNKLVQKSLARLYYNDVLRFPDLPEHTDLAHFASIPKEKSYEHRELESTMVKASHDEYKKKVEPSTLLPREIGNTYTASLYMGLTSLVFNQGDHLADKRMLMFSYGSGLAASMFSFHGMSDPASKQTLKGIQQALDLKHRLAARTRVAPEEFDKTMEHREQLHKTGAFEPTASVDDFFPGTFFLTAKDSLGRRTYDRVPTAAAAAAAVHIPSVTKQASQSQ